MSRPMSGDYVAVDSGIRSRITEDDKDKDKQRNHSSFSFTSRKALFSDRCILLATCLIVGVLVVMMLRSSDSGQDTDMNIETPQTQVANPIGSVFSQFSSAHMTRDELVKMIYSTPVSISAVVDPLCSVVDDSVYTCSGYCPYLDLPNEAEFVNEALVQCDFLPRNVSADALAAGFYCQLKYPDGCPDFNSFAKDSMPGAVKGITRVPTQLVRNFTLNGRITVSYNEGYEYRGTEFEGFKSLDRADQIAVADIVSVWDQNMINSYYDQIKNKSPIGTYGTRDLYAVMESWQEFAIQGKKTAVLGSERPWIEAMLLWYGSAQVTCVEYARINSKVPNLLTITPSEYEEKRKLLFQQGKHPELFDSIWSYSSLEHDGLGRYGDPINPYGDLQTMVKISCMLKPGGFLFLGIPTQKEDELVWNKHRIYGLARIPLLFRHFHIVQIYGHISDQTRQNNQPVWVLQNKIGCKPEQ